MNLGLGSHGFQYAGSIGLLPISEATDKTLMMLGDVLTKQFDLSGLFGIDIILDGDQVWTIEVNPRYTASMEICEAARVGTPLSLTLAIGSRPLPQLILRGSGFPILHMEKQLCLPGVTS